MRCIFVWFVADFGAKQSPHHRYVMGECSKHKAYNLLKPYGCKGTKKSRRDKKPRWCVGRSLNLSKSHLKAFCARALQRSHFSAFLLASGEYRLRWRKCMNFPSNLQVNSKKKMGVSLKFELLFVLIRQITHRFDQNSHFVLPIIHSSIIFSTL